MHEAQEPQRGALLLGDRAVGARAWKGFVSQTEGEVPIGSCMLLQVPAPDGALLRFAASSCVGLLGPAA
jgi:hypothetical protein